MIQVLFEGVCEESGKVIKVSKKNGKYVLNIDGESATIHKYDMSQVAIDVITTEYNITTESNNDL